MLLVAPLLRHNVYWPVEPELFSHDAERSGGTAVASTKIEQKLTNELWRGSDVRRNYTTNHADAHGLDLGAAVIQRRGQQIPPKVVAASRYKEVEVPHEKYPRRALVTNVEDSFVEELCQQGWEVDRVEVKDDDDYR